MATETKSEQVRVVFVGNSAVAEKASPGSPEVHRPPGPMETSLPKDGDGLLLASLGFRAVAWVIDLLVVMLVAGMAGVARLRLVYALPLFFIAYHTSLVSLTGSTVGKALFGLRVNRSAKRINVAWALGRATLGYLVVDLFGLGLVAALFNAQRRCFHDFAFRSDVVFEGDDKLRAKILLSRLIDFAQRQQSAWEEKKKPLTLLKGLWEFLIDLAKWLEKGINFLRRLGRATSKLSAAAIPFKAAMTVMTVTTAATVGTVASIPPARAAVERYTHIATVVSALKGTPGSREVTVRPGQSIAQGAPGAAGQTGAQGTTGSQGAPGAAGQTAGQTGAQGTTGSQGAPGAGGQTGAQGTTGAQGAPGPTGPPGATGPAGPPGPAGVTDAWWSGQVNLQIPASGTTTVDLSRSSLPAGDYLIQAMFYLTAYPVTHNPSDSVQCLVTGSDAQVIQMLDRSQALPSLGRLTVTTAVPPRTKCTSSFASGTTDVQVYASAIRVTNIHQ